MPNYRQAKKTSYLGCIQGESFKVLEFSDCFTATGLSIADEKFPTDCAILTYLNDKACHALD